MEIRQKSEVIKVENTRLIPAIIQGIENNKEIERILFSENT